MNLVNKVKNRIHRKDGSFSIEAILGMTGVLMVTFLGIAYFTYLAPRQVLTQDVHMLAQTAKIQGGLTDETSEPGYSDVDRFKERMEEKGFDPNKIVITAKAKAQGGVERNVLGVEPLTDGYIDPSNAADPDRHYSHRNSKEVITIHVTIPSNVNFINAMSKYWTGENSSLGDYKFSETIMSERW